MPKGKTARFRPRSLKSLDALAKLRKNDIAPGIDHALPQGFQLL